jgi:hypothetical protein
MGFLIRSNVGCVVLNNWAQFQGAHGPEICMWNSKCLHLYDFMTILRRQQAEVLRNHEKEVIQGTG